MMEKLFKELRRRNVFRVAGVYAVIGWLLAQVAATLEGALSLPGWFDAVIVSALLIGFPVALVLAWAFEVTPDGVKLTAAVPEGESIHAKTGRKLDYAIVGGLALVAIMIVADRLMPEKPGAISAAPSGEPAPSEVSDASIAVLPFADLSPDQDQEYFSDGIAEEILNVLVRINDLKVASRTSAFGFKGQEALGIPVIAEKLNVRHVLEGSVRKSGNTVRITAQLIDAVTDQHLWSQTYDRTLTAENLFAIQDEIANAIVQQLGLVIEGEARAPEVKVEADTQNLDAYEKFLEARALFVIRDNNRLPKIIEEFEQAVAADPDFARGWAGLAAAYAVAPAWDITDREYLKLSSEAAARAIALNPDLSLPYAVLGAIEHVKKPAQLVRAIDFYNEALKRDPNDVEALQWRGEAYIYAGFFDLAAKDIGRCLDVAPEYSQCLVDDAKIKLFKGEIDDGLAAFEKATALGAVGAGEWHAPFAYAYAGDKRAVLLALTSIFHRYHVLNGRSVRYFRALTDPDFDFEKEAAELVIEVAAFTGRKFEWNDSTAFIFRQYDKVTPSIDRPYWWYWFVPEFTKTPHRKRLIRESGIYDYWRAKGFPPQCRPVGPQTGETGDFTCD